MPFLCKGTSPFMNSIHHLRFALIELMVVGTVIAILSVLALTALQQVTGFRGLTGAMSQVSEALNFARQTAISNRGPTAIGVLSHTTRLQSACHVFAVLQFPRSATTSGAFKVTNTGKAQ